MPSIKTPDFSLELLMKSGQTFCWTHKETELAGKKAYIAQTVRDGSVVKFWQEKGNLDTLHYSSTGSLKEEQITKWFGLGDDFGEIIPSITRDPLVAQAVKAHPGLRNVHDPLWPCLVSFIIAARNNIPSIQKSMNLISKHYGTPVQGSSETFYEFPSAERLAELDVKEFFDKSNTAFRAKHIIKTAQLVVDGALPTQQELERMPYEEAKEHLLKLQGIGEKVADCILLFSLHKLESFPIDVWIDRVLREHYPSFPTYEKTKNSYRKAAEAARGLFGPFAGYAQDYLYYYKRNQERQAYRASAMN